MYSYCILTTLLVVFTMVNLEVDASYNTPHHSWKGYSYSMLCNHHGSKVAKAHKVRKELVDDYKGFLWFILITDKKAGWGASRKTGGFEFWDDNCGYDMWIWFIDQLEVEQTSCTDEIEKMKVEAVMAAADCLGKSSEDVRDRVKQLMKVFGIKYNFIAVYDDGNTGAAEWVYESCLLKHVGHHIIYVYL